MNLLNNYPTSNSRKHTPKRQKKAPYNPRQNSNKCTNSPPPSPPTNVKVTHKICHELHIGINISLYSLPGIWHYRPFTTLWSVCYSMLYERPGANVGTYKQTDRAVTSSHTQNTAQALILPMDTVKFNLLSLYLPSPSPIPNDQYISILRQENNNHSTELISSFLNPYFLFHQYGFLQNLYPESSKSFSYWISVNLVYETIYSWPALFHFFYLSFQKSLIRLIFSSLHSNHNHNISLSKKNNAWESMNIRLSLLM